jgi:hypothetical protein
VSVGAARVVVEDEVRVGPGAVAVRVRLGVRDGVRLAVRELVGMRV